jgi:hypothetical protein
VQKSDGTTGEVEARFQWEHFEQSDGNSKLRVVVVFPNASKSDVPIGSQLVVSEEVFRAVRGDA